MIHKKAIGFKVRTLANLIKRYIDNQILNKYNITAIHAWVIGFLYNNQDKDIYQKDIEEEFSIRRSTATAILQLMEKNQLIVRKAVSYDARLKKLELTSKAIELQRQIQSDFNKLEEQLSIDIPNEELDAFYTTMEKMIRNIE